MVIIYSAHEIMTSTCVDTNQLACTSSYLWAVSDAASHTCQRIGINVLVTSHGHPDSLQQIYGGNHNRP